MTAPATPPETAAAWVGSDLAATPGRWIHEFTGDEVAGMIDLARRHADTDLITVDLLTDASPALRDLALGIRAEMIDGLGFMLLKGYPIGDVDRRTEALGFLVLGRLVGTLRSQNAAGHLLGHVKDVGRDLADAGTRIYQTNERQGFHTDSTDCVGLLCRRTAASGGRSLLASAETAYRLLVERRPDLAPLLFEPIATDRRGEIPDGADPWFEIPVLSWHDGRLTVLYQRTYIDAAAGLSGAPRPSPQHVEALDLWDTIVNEPQVHLAMDLEPGDVQFVYNHALLHDRTAFVDHPEPDRRRHLLRLWLSLPGDRSLPPVFAQRYGSLQVGDRGGIVVGGTTPTVPLDVV